MNNNTQLTTLKKYVKNIIFILTSKGHQHSPHIPTPEEKMQSTKRSEIFLDVVCIVCAFIFNGGCLIKLLKLKNEMLNNLVSITMGFSLSTFILLGIIKILADFKIDF